MVNVMRSAPQKALDFFIFDGFKRLLGASSGLGVFAAAGAAGAVSNALLFPLEVRNSLENVSKKGLETGKKVVSRHRGCGQHCAAVSSRGGVKTSEIAN